MSDKPVETPAVEAKAVEATNAEATPAIAAETTPAEPTPATEATPVAAETKPTETAPVETKAAEPVAAAKENTKPAEEKPVETAVAAPAEVTVTPIQALWAAAKQNGHPEIWGVTLADPETDIPSQIVFQKYLNANDGDLAKAKDQLIKTLQWRAKTKPLELIKKEYSGSKFAGLGYVTSYTAGDAKYDPSEPESKEIFTWNIYGSTPDITKTFGDLQEFLDWRVALMELSLQDLDLQHATKPITADYDPYKSYQVHDYKSISFLRAPPKVKAASTETIKIFGQNYPELLKEKFFVNVPAIMGFVYAFMKLFVAPKTIKKFHPMSNGDALAYEFGSSRIKNLGQLLPKEYGGTGAALKDIGVEPALIDDAPAVPAKGASAEAAKEDVKAAAPSEPVAETKKEAEVPEEVAKAETQTDGAATAITEEAKKETTNEAKAE